VRATLLTIALLAGGLALDLLVPRPDPDEALAEKLLGQVERIDLPGPAAFESADGALLFFERAGMEGPIRGAVRLERDLVAEVIVLRSREGIDRAALETKDFLAAFRGKPAQPPVVVEAVTGATISSQAVIDAVNERLRTWKARNE